MESKHTNQRRFTVETYACSCEGGVEYGLCLKDLVKDTPGGEEYAADDHELSIVTWDRDRDEPKDEEQAYNECGQKDLMEHIIARYNASSDLLEALRTVYLHLRDGVQTGETAALYNQVCAALAKAS